MSEVLHHKPGSAELSGNSFPRARSARFAGEAKIIRFPERRLIAQASAGPLNRETARGTNIVEFRRRGHLPERQIAPQTALEVLASNNEYAVRMVENSVAGAAILALIAAGYWSLSTLAMLS